MPAFDAYHKLLGIPPKDQPPNYYRLLGIEVFEQDVDVIRNAADQRMRHMKSFQSSQHQIYALRLLGEIQAAKKVLMNPAQKAAYDSSLVSASVGIAEQLPPEAEPMQPIVAVRPSSSGVSVSPVAVGGGVQGVRGVQPSSAESPRRKPKSAVAEIIKIVGGGAGGLLIGIVVLGFIRKDWDYFGIAKATRNYLNPALEAELPKDPKEDGKPRPGLNQPPQPAVEEPPPPNPNEQLPEEHIDRELPPLVGEVQFADFSWERGRGDLDLGNSSDRFVITSLLAGYYRSDKEWVETIIGGNGHFKLQGSGEMYAALSGTTVRSPYRAWFEDEVNVTFWMKEYGPVRIIHQNDGFGMLCGVRGPFANPGHSIRVHIDPRDGYWYVTGKTDSTTMAKVQVYRFKQSGKFKPRVKEISWPGSEQTPLTPVKDSLCFVSGISGYYRGLGENLNVTIGDDACWRAFGRKFQSTTSGKFTVIEFNTPEMLALSPTPPNVKLAPIHAKSPRVVTQPPTPKNVPPDADAQAIARGSMAPGALQANSGTLLAAAAKNADNDQVYVLLLAARDRAIEEGNCYAALRALDGLVQRYSTAVVDVQIETVLALRDKCTSPQSSSHLATLALELLEQAKRDEKKQVLIPLAEASVVAARNTDDADLVRRATLTLLETRKLGENQ